MPVGIYKRSKEHCKNISKSKLGHKVSKETRKKMSDSHNGQTPWNKGKKLSVKTIDKIKLSKENISKETRDKISKANKDRIFSKTHREKLAKAKKGKHHSKETRTKISLSKIGCNNPCWKGGISFEPYCHIWTDKEYKNSIKERDGNKCLNPYCISGINLVLHHINYNKKECSPFNLITVCRSCNGRANIDRDWHESWYNAIIYQRYLRKE